MINFFKRIYTAYRLRQLYFSLEWFSENGYIQNDGLSFYECTDKADDYVLRRGGNVIKTGELAKWIDPKELHLINELVGKALPALSTARKKHYKFYPWGLTKEEIDDYRWLDVQSGEYKNKGEVNLWYWYGLDCLQIIVNLIPAIRLGSPIKNNQK